MADGNWSAATAAVVGLRPRRGRKRGGSEAE